MCRCWFRRQKQIGDWEDSENSKDKTEKIQLSHLQLRRTKKLKTDEEANKASSLESRNNSTEMPSTSATWEGGCKEEENKRRLHMWSVSFEESEDWKRVTQGSLSGFRQMPVILRRWKWIGTWYRYAQPYSVTSVWFSLTEGRPGSFQFPCHFCQWFL